MRLIDTTTYEISEDTANPPRYAILSHTWNPTELSFRDFKTIPVDTLKLRASFQKIEYTCAQAAKEGYRYVWIDSCCIEKESSAALSRAINSMFSWYKRAEVCYVYLEDVHKDSDISLRDQFAGARWFERGWTLQELLASNYVKIYGSRWQYLGTSDYLVDAISSVTGIGRSFLYPKARPKSSFENATIAQRMSWASQRTTTEVEDQAYSLLGIFNVNISVLYGEGKRAFMRLQEEIMKVSTDHSIFAWNRTGGMLLATSPKGFSGCGNISSRKTDRNQRAFSLSNAGMRISLPVGFHERWGSWLCVLNCRYDDADHDAIGLRMQRIDEADNELSSVWRFKGPLAISSAMKWAAQPNLVDHQDLLIPRSAVPDYSVFLTTGKSRNDLFRRKYIIKTDLKLAEVHPYQNWIEDTSSFVKASPSIGVIGSLILQDGNCVVGIVLVDVSAGCSDLPGIFATSVVEPVDFHDLEARASRNSSTLSATAFVITQNGGALLCYVQARPAPSIWTFDINVARVNNPEPHVQDLKDSKTSPRCQTPDGADGTASNTPSNCSTKSTALNDCGSLNGDGIGGAGDHDIELEDLCTPSRLVLALDYGNKDTAFAYATPLGCDCTIYDVDLITDWGPGQGNVDRVPSVISYEHSSTRREVIQWGADPALKSGVIRDTRLELEQTGGHPSRNPRYSNWSRDRCLNYAKASPEAPPRWATKTTVEVITDYLTKICEYVMTESVLNADIRMFEQFDFVITVPDFWSSGILNVFMRAVDSAFNLKTSFPNLKNVLAVSETEAATIYATSYLAEFADKHSLKVNDVVVLCDAKGDSVDAVSYRIRSIDPIQLEDVGILAARGQGWRIVDKRFRAWLREMLGEYYFRLDSFADYHPNDDEDFLLDEPLRSVLNQFEVIKEDCVRDLPSYIDLPRSLQGLSTAKVDYGEVTLSYDDLVYICYPALDEAIEAIQSQIHQLEQRDLIVNCVVVTGKYSEAPWFGEELEKLLRGLKIKLHRPEDAGTAAVRGAVIYGIESMKAGRVSWKLDIDSI